jgi:hypothetical protein
MWDPVWGQGVTSSSYCFQIRTKEEEVEIQKRTKNNAMQSLLQQGGNSASQLLQSIMEHMKLMRCVYIYIVKLVCN